jgi:hypothetical protein
MQLIYRAQVIYRPDRPTPAYRKPAALNWRFQAPGEDYEASLSPKPYQAPQAINWRWQ